MLKKILLVLISVYQKQPLRPNTCRFSPTCSEYCYHAVEKYGTILGLFKCVSRIARCHPWNKGGYDPLK